MEEYPLSPEFESLAARLRELPAIAAPPGLRERVLERVATELQRTRRIDCWMYAGGMAAAVVLWINLSWIASRETSFAVPSPQTIDARARQIEQLVPGITSREAQRHAFVIDGGRRLAVSPSAGGPLPGPSLWNSL